MPKRINLALQGGGAHGAFTWGVLEGLLEDDDIEIAAISGTSAGALNAAAVKAGLSRGGREAALENLDWFWRQVGAVTDERLSAWMSAFGPSAPWMAQAMEYSPAFASFDILTRIWTPYLSGNLFKNPLRRVVEKFDFQHVCSEAGPEIHICATNVRSGKIRVFSGDDISPDAILASACLPTLFPAVEIEDPRTGRTEAYWDGGYTGNPALYPLYMPHLPDDVVIVNINPLYREELPTEPQQIQNRINEISFNSSLLRELRAIDFVKRLLRQGSVEAGQMKDVLVHMISDDELMNELSVATKMVPSPVVMSRLRQAGRTAAETFLAKHREDLGEQGTVDLREMFS